jgi:hypothetical protein
MSMTEVPLQCSKCQQPVTINASIPPRIMNLQTCSIVVLEHDGQIVCPHCNAVLIPVVGQVGQIGMLLPEVPPDKQKQIIVPGNGMKI